MTLYGVDLSSNNPGFPVGELHRQGFSFLTARCSIGSHTDTEYLYLMSGAKTTNTLFAAYHFLKSAGHTPIKDQVTACVAGIRDKSIPLMLDWEEDINSIPLVGDAVAFINGVRAAGIRIGNLYFPHWYWTKIGSPTVGLPPYPLVNSNYGGNVSTYASVQYNNIGGDSAAGWGRYAGDKVPVILQIGSRIKIDHYSGLVDADVYKGTLEQLKTSRMFKDWGAVTVSVPPDAPTPHWETLSPPWTDRITDEAGLETHSAAYWLEHPNQTLKEVNAKLDRIIKHLGA